MVMLVRAGLAWLGVPRGAITTVRSSEKRCDITATAPQWIRLYSRDNIYNWSCNKYNCQLVLTLTLEEEGNRTLIRNKKLFVLIEKINQTLFVFTSL